VPVRFAVAEIYQKFILEVIVVQLRKLLKVTVAGLLVVASVSCLFACTKKDDGQSKEGKLPLQYENQRYYFQQGYRTDWEFVQKSTDGRMINAETGLVYELAPFEANETDEETGLPKITGAQIPGVEYCCYYYKSDSITMTSTRKEVVEWLRDSENAEFYFNNHHNLGDARDTFLAKDEVGLFTAKYSKLQFNTVSYTFVRDGEDWQGVYNLVMGKREYFIITFEAKKELFDTYYDAYLETIGDFRKSGWETSDVG